MGAVSLADSLRVRCRASREVPTKEKAYELLEGNVIAVGSCTCGMDTAYELTVRFGSILRLPLLQLFRPQWTLLQLLQFLHLPHLPWLPQLLHLPRCSPAPAALTGCPAAWALVLGCPSCSSCPAVPLLRLPWLAALLRGPWYLAVPVAQLPRFWGCPAGCFGALPRLAAGLPSCPGCLAGCAGSPSSPGW